MHRRPPWMLAACLLAACTANTTPPEKDMGLDPATAAYQQHGYNDRPVEARLGPHRFLIPANYFYDQIGPDFQGNVALSVQWPDLQPLPPGTNFHDDKQTFYKAIGIHADHIDRVPIQTLLDRMIRPDAAEGPDDPNENLHLRIEGEPIHGLTPYYADLARLEAHFRKSGAYTNRERLLAWAKDWYIARDPRGNLTTVIKCDSRELPDGLTIHGDRIAENKEEGNASCNHDIVIPEDSVSVSIEYNRAFLKDWKRIEDRVRGIFSQYRAQ